MLYCYYVSLFNAVNFSNREICKVMVNMGLSAKKEKDDSFQHMKKEVAELIRMRIPYIKSKVP